MQMGKRESFKENRCKCLILLLVVFCPFISRAQRDMILLRDGSVRKANIIMVNNERTVFSTDKNSSSQEEIPNRDIYMIKYDKRGNVFFTDEGERFDGEGDGKIPSKAVAIYLLNGKEIIGYNVVMNTETVSYTTSKRGGKDLSSLKKSDVFLVVWPDGTRDMLNDFETVRLAKEAALKEKLRQEEEARLAELRSRYPKAATIKTIKNVTLRVNLLSEDEKVVTYTRTEKTNGLVYHMDRSNIKDIMYNE